MNFGRMVQAEVRLVFGRASGKAALVLGLVIGVGSVAGLHYAATHVANQVQATGGQELNLATMLFDFSWRGAAGYALKARNFFVLPLVLLLATGTSVAGEVGDHTLREVLVRPIPRSGVLAAKVAALAALSLATLVATLVPAVVGGLVAFGAKGASNGVFLGYLASWASDIGLIALGVLASTFLRSAGVVAVTVILYLLADLVARVVLKLLGTIGVPGAGDLARMLPGAALACWEGWNTGWAWQPFAGLAVLVAACLGVALVRFRTMDVP